jgi:hypothetical protein
MNDIIIPGKLIKRELTFLLVCYLLANLVNAFAILFYKTNWAELFTYQPLIVFISVLFYVVVLLLRGIYHLFGYFSGNFGKDK